MASEGADQRQGDQEEAGARPDGAISGLDLVTVARMSGMEAALAAAKLREERVPCFVADTNIAIADPLVYPNVPVQVHERDLDRARSILNRPAKVEADDEYAEEAWRCGKCHRKTVELVPM